MWKALQTKIFSPVVLLLRLGLIYFILAHYTGCVWWAIWETVPGEGTIFPANRQPVGKGPIPSLYLRPFWPQYTIALVRHSRAFVV
jgi:hypothetical protein